MSDHQTVQKKTFTNWVNNQIQNQPCPTVKHLYTDLSDGIILIALLVLSIF